MVRESQPAPAGEKQSPDNPTRTAEGVQFAELKTLIESVLDDLHPGHHARIEPDSALDSDLGFDSLGRVELITRIERAFVIRLSDESLQSIETPRDLLNAINSATSPRICWRAEDRVEEVLESAERPPDHAQTMIEVLEWQVQHHPDRPHIRFYQDDGNGAVISYRQLERRASGVAAALQRHGVRPGQSVAIMLPTSSDYFYSFFGIQMAGAIPVPLYPPARKTQLEDHLRRQTRILDNCQAVMLITVSEAVMLAHLVQAQLPDLKHVVTRRELQAVGNNDFTPPQIKPDDIAFLQYTSGSTGDPKGVILTHANLLANIRADGRRVEASPDDVFVSWLPLYHDMGLIGAWFGSLYYAIRLVIMSPLDFLARPERWLWAIHRHRGTLSAAPNFAYELCLHRVADEDIQGLDLSSWRLAFNGAEPVDPETVTGFCHRYAAHGFGDKAMYPVYGLAESTVGLAFPPLGQGLLIDHIDRSHFMRTGEAKPVAADEGGLKFTACGRPLDDHEIRIVDQDGHELPDRREGRLEFLGPSATQGYFRNPETTEKLFNGPWLDSGDRAYIADRDIYITGRIKDIIILAGRNIYPQELEEAVGGIEGIRRGRVVAFGSLDTQIGTERLIVMAETRCPAGQHEQLRRAINDIIIDLTDAPPDEVLLVPPGTILKTSSGKLRRAACLELYEKGRIGRGPVALWRQVAHLAMSGAAGQLRYRWRRAKELLFAGYAWLLFGLAVPTAWVILLLAPGFQRRWRLLSFATRILFRASGIRLTVRGREHLQQIEGAIVMASNHCSLLDPYVLVGALPRAAVFLAKAELLKGAFSSYFLRRMQVEFVDRFHHAESLDSAERSIARIQEGDSMLFFPEGTFTRSPGLLPFHMGAFLTAARTGRPVLPVAIRGTREILRSESWTPHHGSIQVTIGVPLQPATGDDPWQAARQLRDATREFILLHCGEPDLGQEKSPSLINPEGVGDNE